MLVANVPELTHYEISCKDIHRFESLKEAVLFQKLKGGMIIHEQGKDIYYVMPEFTEVLTGGCYEPTS